MATRGSPLIVESPYPDLTVDKLLAKLTPDKSAPDANLLDSVIAVATEFESVLQHAAKRAGLEINSPRAPVNRALIATGHQPVVYHPGLLAKEEQAERIGLKLGATSVNFILDLDEHDCTEFAVALVVNDTPTETKYRLGGGVGLPITQRIETAIEGEGPVFSAYRKLLSEPIAVANTVVRRAFAKIALWHVPFSFLVCRPEVQRVLVELSQSPSLFTVYNESLKQHRLDNRIQNAANPFPNLESGELPMWIWNFNSNSRRILQAGDSLSPNEFLVPRGAFVSLFLRKYCCGLFIHGTGGKTYEPAVEKIAKDLNLEIATPYIIVSANRYPFTNFIDRLENLQTIIELVRSGPSHVQELLSRLTWSENERSNIMRVSAKKTDLIAELQLAKSAPQSVGRSTREIGIEIKGVDNELRSVIDASPIVSRIRDEYAKLSSIESLLYRRDFPFWCSDLAS